MKLITPPSKRAISEGAFTLIEMIGVLAVIAILAAVLIPKVFDAINNARVSSAAMSINTVKTACVDHYSKYGAFPIDGSQSPPKTFTVSDPQAQQFDNILVKEGFLDKPFVVKIGDGTFSPTNSRIQLISAAVNQAASGVNGAYNLSGTSSTNETYGTWLIEAVITGVTLADAQALNAAIDGPSPSLGPPAANAADTAGRVEYGTPNAGVVPEVHVYLTHR